MSDTTDNQAIIDALKSYSKRPPSPVGIRVAELLEDWGGLHHFSRKVLQAVEWNNPRFITLKLDRSFLGSMASFDGDVLTRLIFLCHDYAIRVEISPVNFQKIALMFHPRWSRDRSMPVHARHPTLEEAVERWRERHSSHQPMPQTWRNP